jgi:hypothetical protein
MERDHCENLGVDGRIILEWILGKEWEGVDWIQLAGDRDNGNQPSGSMKGGEFLD